jgi:hypothetical protein
VKIWDLNMAIVSLLCDKEIMIAAEKHCVFSLEMI